MRWIINLSNKANPEIRNAIQFCKDFLSNYDTSKLEYVRIDNGRTDYKDFYGRCHYPKNKKGFKVSCQINKSIIFPHKKLQRRSPLYFVKKDKEITGCYEQYERLKTDPNIKLGAHIIDITNGMKTSWVRIYEYVIYRDFAECLISIFGHEIGHFLSKTKQIPYKNTEIEIDKFESEFLKDYRLCLK